jgi:hypothetical protein
VHSFLGAVIISSSLTITRDKDASSSYPARIEAFFITSPASTLNPAKAIDRFSAVLSVSAKSFL